MIIQVIIKYARFFFCGLLLPLPASSAWPVMDKPLAIANSAVEIVLMVVCGLKEGRSDGKKVRKQIKSGDLE